MMNLRKSFFSIFGGVPLALVHLIPDIKAYDMVYNFLIAEDIKGVCRSDSIDPYNGAYRKSRPCWWYLDKYIFQFWWFPFYLIAVWIFVFVWRLMTESFCWEWINGIKDKKMVKMED